MNEVCMGRWMSYLEQMAEPSSVGRQAWIMPWHGLVGEIIERCFERSGCLIESCVSDGVHFYLQPCSVSCFAKFDNFFVGIVEDAFAVAFFIGFIESRVGAAEATVKSAGEAPADAGEWPH